MMSVKWFCPLLVSLVAPVLMAPATAAAQTKGMVAANDHTVTIFDADTNTVITTLPLPGFDGATGDCSITADGTRGFVADFSGGVQVIDLVTDTLAGGPNPILIANAGEDTSITPDGRYVVVCGGGGAPLISVIDAATQTEISTFDTGSDCNSVDVCSDGSVLVTSLPAENVRRLTIDAGGTLSDTGDILDLGAEPNNVACAPGAASGIVITRGVRDIRSFTIPGLAVVDQRFLAGGIGNTVVISADGKRAYTRDNLGQFLQGWSYDAATGALGAAALFTTFIADTQTFFGMDQIALHPTTGEVYVSQPFALNRYNPFSGALVGTIPLPTTATPTGICFTPTNAPPSCSAAAAGLAELWPPNHQLVDVNVTGVTDPDGDPVTITVTGIRQDEPTNAISDGNTCPDANGVGTATAHLRAERAGSKKVAGDGRVYHLGFSASDGRGGTCTGSVAVCVPHDQRPGHACIDEGPLFDSLVCGP